VSARAILVEPEYSGRLATDEELARAATLTLDELAQALALKNQCASVAHHGAVLGAHARNSPEVVEATACPCYLRASMESRVGASLFTLLVLAVLVFAVAPLISGYAAPNWDASLAIITFR
jgi:hypothetical protein